MYAESYSQKVDFIYYPSTVTPDLRLAARVRKPPNPSYILASTHGWHHGIPAVDEPVGLYEADYAEDFLLVEVDMRGRPHSDGVPDCNGSELRDVIDAVDQVRSRYAEHVLDPSVVYFDCGSGGGGNALALAGKFPDFFTAVTALCPIADYGLWYEQDAPGEFRDEMEVWIGGSPQDNPHGYRSRSGLSLVENLHSPLLIIHGADDIRIPSEHSRRYVDAAERLGKSDLVTYVELAGVGNEDHFGNATMEHQRLIAQHRRSHVTKHRTPPRLAPRGDLVVGGYVSTRQFIVGLESMDDVATISYDLSARTITTAYPGRVSVSWT